MHCQIHPEAATPTFLYLQPILHPFWHSAQRSQCHEGHFEVVWQVRRTYYIHLVCQFGSLPKHPELCGAIQYRLAAGKVDVHALRCHMDPGGNRIVSVLSQVDRSKLTGLEHKK